MKALKFKNVDRYTKIEIGFFVIFFFLFPVLTDIEYLINEAPCQQCDQAFINTFIHRLVFGIFSILPFLFLYKFVIHRFLLGKKYFAFILAYIVFLFAYNFYILYCMYWPISKMSFLPKSITESAGKWFQSKNFFHFSIIYVTNQALVFSALAYFTHFGRQEKKMNELKRAKLESDLNYLKAQMQPHFFFNTLNNIYSLALKQSAATAPMVAGLSEVMRYIIYETDKPKVLLEKEVDFLDSYIKTEAVRYDDTVTISFDTQGINNSIFIEPLLLLPFVENAFKHGAQHETQKGFIDIVICLSDMELTLQVRNSKPGLKSKEKSVEGIGLANAGKRLALLYPGRHSIVTNESEKIYEVILNLQLSE